MKDVLCHLRELRIYPDKKREPLKSVSEEEAIIRLIFYIYHAGCIFLQCRERNRGKIRDRKMVKTMITLDNVYGTNYRDNVLISKHFFE